MISYDVLLKNLEEHVAAAKRANSQQQMREEIAAAKALCDVLLMSEQSPHTTSQQMQSVNMESKQQTIQQVPHQTKQLQSTSIQNGPSSILPMSTQKLEEEEANGNSIFDF